MNRDLYSPIYGPLHFTPPRQLLIKMPSLPNAGIVSATNDMGSIHLQEYQTESFLFRYFIFYFLQPVVLLNKEKNEGLQTLISWKGRLHHGFKGQKSHQLNEGQFTLLNAGTSETQTLIPAGKECHLFNTYYTAQAYTGLWPLFPALQKHLSGAAQKPRFFLPFPKPARPCLLDGIYKALTEQFRPHLVSVFWDIKIKETLFTSLAQTFTEPHHTLTAFETEKATLAKAIIEEDISVHYTNDELARKVHCSESALKNAFTRQYGIGMYEHLISLRMQKARELLLQGHLVKTAALEVGMQPSNFTMEFQKYFGYKATSLYRTKE
jgi:AraC-like DNA-binding protein